MKASFCICKTPYGDTHWNKELSHAVPKDYVQITEYVDVDLPDLPQETVIKGQLDQLQKMEDSINLKAAEALAEVNRRRQELMALTHTPGEG